MIVLIGPNQWPAETDLPTFRIKMETLFERYHSLNIMLNKHICELLNIPYNVLDDFFSEKIEFNSALWHYFPLIPEMLQEAKDEFLQGMHEHRDPSTFVTCLIQSRQGLEVQNHHGKWVDVPYVKGGVVCNIGTRYLNDYISPPAPESLFRSATHETHRWSSRCNAPPRQHSQG